MLQRPRAPAKTFTPSNTMQPGMIEAADLTDMLARGYWWGPLRAALPRQVLRFTRRAQPCRPAPLFADPARPGTKACARLAGPCPSTLGALPDRAKHGRSRLAQWNAQAVLQRGLLPAHLRGQRLPRPHKPHHAQGQAV